MPIHCPGSNSSLFAKPRGKRSFSEILVHRRHHARPKDSQFSARSAQLPAILALEDVERASFSFGPGMIAIAMMQLRW
jgi:hypothetical protein